MTSNNLQLNDFQQTFTISFASNLAGTVTFKPNGTQSLQAQATDLLETSLAQNASSFIGVLNTALLLQQQSWSIDLQPLVYVAPDDVKSNNDGTYSAAATNALFVAKRLTNGKITDYVVSVAGTQPGSLFATFLEDGLIVPTDWPYGGLEGGNPKITAGTASGIEILLNQMGSSITDYLANNVKESGINLTITGHSLGGALVPALGTAIFNENSTVGQDVIKVANANNWNIRMYPTAGPDIGNDDYNTLVRSVFPAPDGEGIYQWNAKVWSSIDMVPHVWYIANMKEISTLYGSDLATPAYVDCIINRLIDAMILTKVSYAPLDPDNTHQFNGSFITPSSIPGYDEQNCEFKDPPTDQVALPDGLYDFMAEALYQHITGYMSAFGLPDQITKYIALPNICNAVRGLYDPALKCDS